MVNFYITLYALGQNLANSESSLLTSFFGALEVLFFGVSNPAEEVVEVVVVVEG